VLDVGALQAYSSSTLKELRVYHASLVSKGSGLVLTGVEARSREVLERTGILEQLGDDNVLGPDVHLGASLEFGLGRGRELLEELQRGQR
jgi:hypothetical protein